MRHATLGDAPRITRMGRSFHEAHKPAWPWDEQAFEALVTHLIGLDGGFVAVTDGGFIAAVIQPNPISPEWVIAKEFLWWAQDGKGARLLAGFRKWAIENGAREIQYSCPPDSKRVQRIFGRTSSPTEIIYSEYV